MPQFRFRRSHLLWLAPRYWTKRLIFWAGGLVIGAVAVLFAMLADTVQQLFRTIVELFPWLPLVLTPAGLALSVALTRRFFPGSNGSGIPQAIAARNHLDQAERARLLSVRIAIGKILLTLVGLATGASIGREGPTVQVGASVMHAIGRIPGGTYRGLILAGSAAGVAAAFNTPLAGIVFAIEEMSRSFEQRTSGLVLTAVIIAGLASLVLFGNYTYFGQVSASLDHLSAWAAVLACGVVGGVMGGLFSMLVVFTANGVPGRAGELVRRYPVAFAAICGLLVALIGFVSGTTVYGTGYQEAKALLNGSENIPLSYGPLKMLATLLCSISGMPGGIFSPSLSVGSGFGAIVAAVMPFAPAGAVVLLGMVSYFSGVVQAPITAFVIVLEMTGGHAMTVPLMSAALIANGVSRLIGAPPIYHALSRNFLPQRS